VSIIFGSTQFFIAAGQTLNIVSAINGDTTNGGDYVGPLVAAAVPISPPQQAATITPTNPRFPDQAVYEYSVTSNNVFAMLIRLDKFYDG
jgi:hypothetical protein